MRDSMNRKWKDIQQDILMFLLRPLVYIWMWFDAKRKVIKDPSFNFKRKEPYVILANHTYLFDVVHVPLRLRTVPFIIASQTLFTKQPTKFLVTQVAHVIPKSKGKSDISTMLKIFSSVKKGYPILIFPEGDTTFYGETGHIEDATIKLIKKLKLDVVTCNVRGGYSSRPRWGIGRRSRHYIELFYKVSIPKVKLAEMSVSEVNEIINKDLYHNEYEYQRMHMISHKGDKLAEGLENVVYVCPHCQSINTIISHSNSFHCESCKSEGYIDKFGFIHDFVYDNLVDWNKFQTNFTDKLRNSKLMTDAFLSYMQMETLEQSKVGKVTLVYENGNLIFHGALEQVIPVSKISNPTVTLRRDFGFKYQNLYYIVNLNKYSAAFLRAVQSKY